MSGSSGDGVGWRSQSQRSAPHGAPSLGERAQTPILWFGLHSQFEQLAGEIPVHGHPPIGDPSIGDLGCSVVDIGKLSGPLEGIRNFWDIGKSLSHSWIS